METRQRQSASASFLPDDHGAGDDTAVSLDDRRGGGRPLFTPRAATADFSQHNSGSGVAASVAAGAGAGAARGSLRSRGSAGGGDGAGSGRGGYRLMDSGGGASLMARSPGNMSVAMSLGSEDSGDAGTTPRAGGGQGGAAGGGGAGSPDGGDGGGSGAGGSFSDILSP